PSESYDEMPAAKADDAKDDNKRSRAHGSSKKHTAGPDGVSGLHVRAIDGRPVVSNVEADSAADHAGVKSGWEIVAIDGEKSANVFKRIGESKMESSLIAAIQALSVEYSTNETVGSEVKIEFVDGNNKHVTKTIKPQAPTGTPAAFGHLPAF